MFQPAAQTAFDKARIIHRDISLGNIMIVRDKEGIDSGILIDWELCIMVESDDDRPGGYVVCSSSTNTIFVLKIL